MPNHNDTTLPIEQNLGFLLHDVARLMRRNFNRLVQDLDLTQAQWQVLLHLSRNEGMNQAQLASRMEVQPISVARLLDRMQSAGWVERRPDPEDRRAFKLYLTDKADPILQQIRQRGAQLRQVTLQGIDATMRQEFLQALVVMRKNLADGDEACTEKRD